MRAIQKHRIDAFTDGVYARRGTRIRLGVLIGSALLSAALSLVAPAIAMYAYLLNAAAPWLAAWRDRASATPS